MDVKTSIFGLLLLLLLIPMQAFGTNDYQLGAGDIISVTIYDEPDLSLGNIKIPPQGKISFPLLGEVKISGLTVRNLEKLLYKKLTEGYLKKPSISIHIVTYRPFFVSGQVKNPGAFPYVNGLTIQKAISIAGGFTERASKGKISLIHEKGDLESEIGDLNQSVKPGDILLIGESLF